MPTKRTEERGYKPVLTLYFPTNNNELSKAQIRQLDSLSFDLIVNSHKTVFVKGHTDDVGSKSYNLSLSEKRAQVVYDYLVKRQVEVHRMLKAAVEMREPAIPYEQLSADALENARKYNRRVEIFMISQ
jgi:outer membrane protein OmpA-like peptidoglycan-associated protein